LSDRPGMDSQKTNSYGLKIFHNFVGFELQSLTSSTDTSVVFSYDADWGNTDSWTPFIYDYFSETLRDRKTFSQEFRLVSNEANLDEQQKIEWVFGVSYLEIKELNLKIDDGNYGDPSDPYGSYSSESSSSSKYKSDSTSLFGNLDYFISESLKISLGLRWEDWKSKFVDTLGDDFNPSNDMSGGKISLVKNTRKGTSIFASIAKGYKQGGFNLGLGLGPDSSNQNLLYDPEYLTNYELGLNSKIFDSRLNLATIIFYSDREDQQVLVSTQVDPSDPNTFSFLTKNAAEGVNYGLEINMGMDLSETLNLFVNLGFLETEIKNWKSRPDLEDRAQAHAPKRSYAIGFNWNPTVNYYLRLDVTGKSSFYYSDSHDKQSDAYSLTNLSLGYQQDKWNAELWARNAFNKYYAVRGFYFGNEPPNFEDTLYQRHGDPRHYGISLRYDF
jgi:iron complex outermembrane receptor protein